MLSVTSKINHKVGPANLQQPSFLWRLQKWHVWARYLCCAVRGIPNFFSKAEFNFWIWAHQSNFFSKNPKLRIDRELEGLNIKSLNFPFNFDWIIRVLNFPLLFLYFKFFGNLIYFNSSVVLFLGRIDVLNRWVLQTHHTKGHILFPKKYSNLLFTSIDENLFFRQSFRL